MRIHHYIHRMDKNLTMRPSVWYPTHSALVQSAVVLCYCWFFTCKVSLYTSYIVIKNLITIHRVDKNLAMTVCLISNALSITVLPVLHKFMGMVMFVFLYGFFLGTPDTLVNVMLIKAFGKEVCCYLYTVFNPFAVTGTPGGSYMGTNLTARRKSNRTSRSNLKVDKISYKKKLLQNCRSLLQCLSERGDAAKLLN